jgi:hypothetical protein
LLVDEALTVWHNEDRPDRISNGDDLAKWRTTITLFKQVTGPFVPPHVLVAAEARLLSGHLWSSSPAESIRLLLRARLAGALTGSQVTKLFCRNALPHRQYNFVRHWLTTLTARRLQKHINNLILARQ